MAEINIDKIARDIADGIKQELIDSGAFIGKWIPVSEGLPEDGRYLCDYGNCIDFGTVVNGEWYIKGVIAWMPLPGPYKAESEEQK